MLKPLHIICLFALLIIIGCDKDTEESFTIKYIYSYDTSKYYISLDKEINGTYAEVKFDLDQDNVIDIGFSTSYVNSHGPNYVTYLETIFDFDVYNLNLNIEFSHTNDSSPKIIPYEKGDIISSSSNWISKNHYLLYHSIANGTTNPTYQWNSPNLNGKYIAFRINKGGAYKYGWIKVSDIMHVGPTVLQR